MTVAAHTGATGHWAPTWPARSTTSSPAGHSTCAAERRGTTGAGSRSWRGGPGAEGLLTTRARELLAVADVVVVDRLAPRAVVDRLPAGVRVVDVGKAPGRHRRAGGHQRPPRRRGAGGSCGGPTSRGRPLRAGAWRRGAAPAFEAHGIPVEVVPGVTSAVAVPAAAGIRSRTARSPAASRSSPATTVPGRPGWKGTTPSSSSWASDGSGGRPTRWRPRAPLHLPVAVIERGFPPDQRVTLGTLADIADRAAEVGVENPAVVVVGDVVGTRAPRTPASRPSPDHRLTSRDPPTSADLSPRSPRQGAPQPGGGDSRPVATYSTAAS